MTIDSPLIKKIRMKKICFIISLLCFTIAGLKAQTITESVEMTGTAGSGDYTPMWHMANRQGVSYKDGSFGYMRNNLEGNHMIGKSGISLNWGFDLVAGTSLTSNVYIQQAYIDLKWKKMLLSLGQKERWSTLGNHRLSSGSLVESGNARPIPQIRFELPEYWNIPGTGEWLAIKGHFAYGWFTDANWQKDFVSANEQRTENVLYHSKSGLLRIGNEKKHPLTVELGLHMVTQFGGTIYNRLGNVGSVMEAPTRLKDFFMAFIPTKGDKMYNGEDQANIAGNILGSWLAAVTWHNKDWKLKINYEHVFEDHSQMFWEYGIWTEQLVGMEVELKKGKWIKAVALEYFNLKNQSGPVYHDTTAEIPDQISCVDNNYWHHTYNGWFNYGMMIGTPLITSPIYNNDHTLNIYNSRVEAFHIGIEGSPTTWLDYRILYSRSNNWGTYKRPFKDIKVNRSGLFEFTFKPEFFKSWSVTTSFAFDSGDLYGDNYGGMITLKRAFTFNLK